MGKREKLGWSRDRIIIWLVAGILSFVFFSIAFEPKHYSSKWERGEMLVYQDGRSEELNKGVRSSKSQDENYLFVYYEGKDTAKQVTEKTKEWAYQDTRTASSSYANYFPTDTPPKMRSRTYWQYKYHYTQIGVMYKMGHGLSFVIGILLPFTLLLLTLLLERAIIRKLEKMNE